MLAATAHRQVNNSARNALGVGINVLGRLFQQHKMRGIAKLLGLRLILVPKVPVENAY
jgi:hypothetical protein